jgi:hypothetical protein
MARFTVKISPNEQDEIEGLASFAVTGEGVLGFYTKDRSRGPILVYSPRGWLRCTQETFDETIPSHSPKETLAG